MRALTAVALALWLAGASTVQAEDSLGVEALADAVPPFALVAADGGPALANGDLLGRFVLLHFWATWCTPCKDELPALARLAASVDAARFIVVLVAIDANTSPTEVLAFARSLGVRLPIYLASSGGVSDSFWGWGLPVSYLIDGRGHFIGRLRGPRAWAEPGVQAALIRLADP